MGSAVWSNENSNVERVEINEGESGMLRVTIELIPSYSPNTKETIATATIVNNGTGTKELGNYDVTFTGEGFKKPFKVRITKFSRLTCGPWALLLNALDVAEKNSIDVVAEENLIRCLNTLEKG